MSADQGNPVGAGGQMSSGSPRNAASRRRSFGRQNRPEKVQKTAFSCSPQGMTCILMTIWLFCC